MQKPKQPCPLCGENQIKSRAVRRLIGLIFTLEQVEAGNLAAEDDPLPGLGEDWAGRDFLLGDLATKRADLELVARRILVFAEDVAKHGTQDPPLMLVNLREYRLVPK